MLVKDSDDNDVPEDVSYDIPVVPSPGQVSKRRPEREKWCGRCGCLVKRDWLRHWKGKHKGFPVCELDLDDLSLLKAPFYGEVRKICHDEYLHDSVGCSEVDSHTRLFNKHLWNLMMQGYRLPYELWGLA